MHVLVGRLEIHVPWSHSLKEKRSVVRRLRDRIRDRFDVACSEVANHDLHQRASLGVAAIGRERAPLEAVWSRVVDFADANFDGEILSHDHEMLDYDSGGR